MTPAENSKFVTTVGRLPDRDNQLMIYKSLLRDKALYLHVAQTDFPTRYSARFNNPGMNGIHSFCTAGKLKWFSPPYNL